MAIGAIPGENEEDGGEGVKGENDSACSEEERRQDPRGCVTMSWVEWLRSPQDSKDPSH